MQQTDFLSAYLNAGFGRLSKTEVELLVFYYLLKDPSFSNLSDSALSRALKITEAKVKNLRYQVDLRYHSDDEEALKERVQKSLLDVNFGRYKDKQEIEFLVQDKFTQQYIREILAIKGRFNEIHFNTSVISMHIEDFSYLVSVVVPQTEMDAFYKIIDNKQNDGRNFEKDFRDALTDIITGALQKLVSEKFAEGTTKLIGLILQKAKEASKEE